MISGRTWRTAQIAGQKWRQSDPFRSFYVDPGHYIPLRLRFAPAWLPLSNSTPMPIQHLQTEVSTRVSCGCWGADGLTRRDALRDLDC
jgi:hypothetical protein